MQRAVRRKAPDVSRTNTEPMTPVHNTSRRCQSFVVVEREIVTLMIRMQVMLVQQAVMEMQTML